MNHIDISRYRLALVVALLATALSGCGVTQVRLLQLFPSLVPKVEEFSVQPTNICAGGSTTVSWKGTDNVSLITDPSLPGTGPVDDSGTQSLVLTQNTLITVEARGWGERDFEEMAVKVFSADPKEELFGDMTACEGQDIVATAALSVDDHDDLLRVGSVTFPAGDTPRRLSISHEGKTGTIDPATPVTDAFRNTRPSGAWVIRSPLAAGEICGNRLHHPPTSLTIAVTVVCGS